MKRFFTLAALAAIIAANAHSLSMEGGIGGAYGFVTIENSAEQSGVTTAGKTTDNAWGLKAEATLGISRSFGIQLDMTFLLPTTYRTLTAKSNSPTVEETNGTRSDSFIFNAFLGPVFISSANSLDVKIGAGLNFSYNRQKERFSKDSLIGILHGGNDTVITNAFFGIGAGVTLDITYLLNKHTGVKVGIVGAYSWTDKASVRKQFGSKDLTATGEYKAEGLYVIPDISLIYKF